MSRSIRATSRADCAVSTFWYARRASAAIRSRVAFICTCERGFVLVLLCLECSQTLLRLGDPKIGGSSFDRKFTAFLHASANGRCDRRKTLDLLTNQGNESC